jgi:hypothetical protein
VGVQFFHETAVLHLLQKRAIDEIARFRIFRIRAGLGEMIENRLNARQGRTRNCRNAALAPIVSAEGTLIRLKSATTLAVVAHRLERKDDRRWRKKSAPGASTGALCSHEKSRLSFYQG